MSDFSTDSIVSARKLHRCSECFGGIKPGEKYERVFVVYDGYADTYKTCLHCKSARDWLTSETDWPNDVDGEGHSYFYTMLREHLMEQAHGGDRKFAFKTYRHIVAMDKRRKAYVESVKGNAGEGSND